ncbi:MAG: formimidoylglutamase [Phycisphaerae bacterium]|nr:formimidoylglutamase [Phycisphaerae bacterium]
MRAPHTVSASWPVVMSPTRMAAGIRTDNPRGCEVALLGLPDDLGVRLNSGRPGAAKGPRAFRDALSRYGVIDPPGSDWPAVFDAGDIEPADGDDEAALTETHRRVSAAAGALIDAGMLPIAIGGGHDLTFPFVRAMCERHDGPVAGMYFDAHLDVRPTAGSGMPFRRLLDEHQVSELFVAGFCPLVNSREHAWYFRSKGGVILPEQGVQDAARAPSLPLLPRNLLAGSMFVSFDLDVLDAAYAPGVSAPNPCGWNPATATAWVTACGADPRVACFDLMELSPANDPDSNPGPGRTARLAAHLFLSFLRGVATRKRP